MFILLSVILLLYVMTAEDFITILQAVLWLGTVLLIAVLFVIFIT